MGRCASAAAKYRNHSPCQTRRPSNINPHGLWRRYWNPFGSLLIATRGPCAFSLWWPSWLRSLIPPPILLQKIVPVFFSASKRRTPRRHYAFTKKTNRARTKTPELVFPSLKNENSWLNSAAFKEKLDQQLPISRFYPLTTLIETAKKSLNEESLNGFIFVPTELINY